MYGGLGVHVVELTREQASEGHEVVVVTQQSDPVSPIDEVIHGVRVLRASNYFPHVAFTPKSIDTWAHGFALGSFACARDNLGGWIPDVIHGHDWVGAEQANLLSHQWGIPLVVTIHATEFGRHQGWFVTPQSRTIHSREMRSIAQADQVIVCSDFMKQELINALGADTRKISVIPNGIVAPKGEPVIADSRPQGSFTIGFLGRVEWEKGAHHVIDALSALHNPRYRVSIIGIGSQLDDLRKKVHRRGLDDSVDFFGYVSIERKRELLGQCNALVVPSSYEPFGIVALEAGISGIPLVVAESGGLKDIVPSAEFGYPLRHVSGQSIAQSISDIDSDPQEAATRAHKLFERVRDVYNWKSISQMTTHVYREALRESAHD
jgi:glycogen synthase